MTATTRRDIQDAAWLLALIIIGFASIAVDLTVGFEAIARLAIQRWIGE